MRRRLKFIFLLSSCLRWNKWHLRRYVRDPRVGLSMAPIRFGRRQLHLRRSHDVFFNWSDSNDSDADNSDDRHSYDSDPNHADTDDYLCLFFNRCLRRRMPSARVMLRRQRRMQYLSGFRFRLCRRMLQCRRYLRHFITRRCQFLSGCPG